MRIGEVARRSAVSARMLRHYDELGIVTPGDRSPAGYRDYTAADLTRLFHVEALRTLGLSLREVRRALDEPDFVPARLLHDLDRRTRERITREQALLARLAQIDDAGPNDWEQVLSMLALLSGLSSPSADRRPHAALTADREGRSPGVPVDALREEADPNVAGALRWALAQTGAAAADALAAELDSSDVDHRRRAVLALTELRARESADVLAAALSDPDSVVRRRAAISLVDRSGGTGPDDARLADAVVEALLALVVEGQGDVEAAEALGVLAAYPDRAGAIARRLAAALTGAAAPERCRIAQALGEIPGALAAQTLTALCSDADDAVRHTATYLLTLREPE